MPTIFISHASEDKAAFVSPLAKALKDAGVGVWYDEYEIRLGDSLRRKIDEGLKRADYGVVVLSQSFFAKKWTQLELDGLFALEDENRKVILPIWYGVNAATVRGYSPMLADRKAVTGDRGVSVVVEEILTAISASDRTRQVSTGGARLGLRTLAKKLSSQELENSRLDCEAGAVAVLNAATEITAAIRKEIEAVDQEAGKSRFVVKQSDNRGKIRVDGPHQILFVAAAIDLSLESALEARFVVVYDRERTTPRPLIDMEPSGPIGFLKFTPRAVDAGQIQWTEEEGDGSIISNSELAERILQRYVEIIDEITE